MEFTEENSLKTLLQNVKKNNEFAPSVKSVQLVNHVEIPNIVGRCSENTVYLRDLFVKHFNSSVNKDKNQSTFTIISPDKTDYTIVVKQKAISLMEIDLLQHVFPNLKSVYLYMFNLRYEDSDTLNAKKVANTISSIDMTFNTLPADISKLIMYIFDNYGENLERLTVKKGGDIIKKDKKWEAPSEEIVNYGKKLLEHNYSLPNLKTVDISHFYQCFPMAEFVKCLSQSSCALKHVSLIGVAEANPLVLHLKNVAKKSLKSLALDTYEYPNLQNLQDFPLESLSLRWGDSTVIDIVSVLKAFPSLKKLELGYDMDFLHLKESEDELNQPSVLESLTLCHAIIDKDVLEKLAHFMPNLHDLKLSNCKFGTSRISMEEALSLEKFHLQQLILENCSLYSSKKDNIEKRVINKLNIAINSRSNYSAEITSKNQASMAKFESISNVDNEFSYCCFNENASRPTNTLKILLKSIKSVKFDSMGFKGVTFTSDGSDYGDLDESFMNPNTASMEINEKESGFQETSNKNVEKRSDEKVNHDEDEKEYDENDSIEEKNDTKEGGDEDRDEIDESDDGEESISQKEEKEDVDDGNDTETYFSAVETKRVEKVQEVDDDFTNSEGADSSSAESEEEEEEEEDLSRRRSLRVRNVSVYINKRELRKRKRVLYNSDISSEESSEEHSDADDKIIDRDAKRTRTLVKKTRLDRSIIRLYPSKSHPGYYR
ncbi:hypothetical protein [Parasitella parasitica]|uniref:Uncharacterized protein n=1 Tax=Parasitella parasitica TaxID=35722 RepID=A0A0B7N8A9_9FUNG|nr:hypothetical protein [Parasitella parasitica]